MPGIVTSTSKGTVSVTDSALRELADDPSSRKRFFKMLGGAGAAGAGSVLLAACGDDTSAGSAAAGGMTATTGGGTSDLKIVNYALTLEYLEAQFYKDVLDSGVVKDKMLGELAKRIYEHERQHVEALTATAKSLGGKPA